MRRLIVKWGYFFLARTNVALTCAITMQLAWMDLQTRGTFVCVKLVTQENIAKLVRATNKLLCLFNANKLLQASSLLGYLISCQDSCLNVFPRLVWWFACRVSLFVSILVLFSCRGSCLACFFVSSAWWFACRVSRFVSILVIVSCPDSYLVCFVVSSGYSRVLFCALYPF